MVVNWNSFKRFFGLLIVLMFCATSYSQKGSRFKFGLNVSPSLNWFNIKTTGIDSRGTIANLNYGLSTDFALKGSDRYFFSTGVQLVSNGGRVGYTSVAIDNNIQYSSQVESKIVARYVEIPISLKLRTHELGYSIFAGMFGFGTGFRVNAFEEKRVSYTSANGSLVENTETGNIQEKINPVRFSVIIGGEWERKITKDTYFTFGLTFNSGLSNVFNSNTYTLGPNGNLDWSSVNADGSANGSKLKGASKTVALHVGIYF